MGTMLADDAFIEEHTEISDPLPELTAENKLEVVSERIKDLEKE